MCSINGLKDIIDKNEARNSDSHKSIYKKFDKLEDKFDNMSDKVNEIHLLITGKTEIYDNRYVSKTAHEQEKKTVRFVLSIVGAITSLAMFLGFTK